MKDSIQSIRNYVLFGFAITALLVGLKLLIEHTSVGHRIELLTFEVLQSTLPSFNPNEELPVAVVDISDIKEKNGQIIDLVKLKEITNAVADQKPRAIAIDVVLTPEFDDSASQDISATTKSQQIKEYFDFLEFCLKLQEEKSLPIYIGVGQRTADKPEEWLGREKYKGLAATTIIKKGDTTRIPIWVKANPAAEKIYSLSFSLSRAYTKPRLPKAISWAIETTEEELPGTLRHLEENIEYADALVNYSKLEAIQQNKLLTLSGTSVKEASEKFHHRMVILGDGKLSGVDAFIVPGQDVAIPGVYLHACAAYTFAREPMYEFKLVVRLALDFFLSLIVFFCIAVVRYQHLNDDRAFHYDKHRSVIIYVIEIIILLAAVVFVYWLGLLWLDFLLVAIALWLHPTFEKIVMWLFVKIRNFVPPKKKSA